MIRAIPHLKVVPKVAKRQVKLGEDRNLLDLYMYATGKSEIPEQYHKWCLLGLVAASVGKRVFFSKFGHAPLHPNLYIFLIGPSAIGKGQAIGFMLQAEHNRHNVLNGAATHKALVQRFSMQAPADHPGYEQIFLLHEELGNSVPPGPMGKAFIKFMTDGYVRAGQYYTDATRKDGEVKFPKPCINWIAGSTPEWLGESVSLEDMMSGFFGRVVGVPAQYDFSRRVYMPSRHDPPDKQEIIDYICGRIHYLTMIPEGSRFYMSKHAEEVDEEWYMNRPQPQDERLMPFFKRESDLALKLAMVLSLCRGQSLEINVDDITQAHELVRESRESMPLIVQWASQSSLTQNQQEVERFLKTRKGWVRRTRVLQHMKSHSVSAKELDEIVEDLEARGTLVSRKRGNTAEYQWEDVGRWFKFG